MDSSSSQDPSEKEFAAIGKFIVAFEEVVQRVRELVGLVLRKNGLSHATMNYAVTADMPVQSLLNLLRTLALLEVASWENGSAKDRMERAIPIICKEIRETVEKRNEVAHGNWEIGGYGYDVLTKEFSQYVPMRGMKVKHSAKGLSARELPDTKQLEELVKELEHILFVLYRLHTILENGELTAYLIRLEKIGKQYKLTYPS